MFRKARGALVVPMILSALVAGFPASAEVKLDLANEYSATSLVGIADQFFIDSVKAKSKGELIITAHYGGALGFKSKDHFDAVGDGAVPIAGTYTGVFTGIDPVFTLSAMPFLTPSLEEAKTLFEVARPYYDKVFAKHNQKLLYASPYTPTGVWAKKAIKSVADLKNLKIRTYDAAGVATFKAIGAAPIQLSWADVVPQLGTGGISAVLTSDESGINGKFWEHLSHFNALPYSVAINMTHMNLDVFNSLSPELQAAVLQAAAETQELNWQRIADRVKRNAGILDEKGIKVVAASGPMVGELQKSADAILAKWTQDMGANGEAILVEYNKRIGD